MRGVTDYEHRAGPEPVGEQSLYHPADDVVHLDVDVGQSGRGTHSGEELVRVVRVRVVELVLLVERSLFAVWAPVVGAHREQYAATGSTRNAKVTERPAGNAEDCAEFMIVLAYPAIEESEYAALQAVPAWQDAYAVC